MKKLCKKNKKLVLAASAVSLGMLAGGVALMNHGYIASAESAFPVDGTIQVLDGTSLKLNAGGGLRFIVKMNAAAKNYIKDDDANDEVKLVVRVGAVKYFGEKWLDCEVDEEKLYRVDGDEAWYANVCLTNVREQNRKLDYTARAYIYSGKTEVKVSDYNENARGNFYDVATAALLDTKQEYTQQILSLENYSWLGADETFPLYIDSLDLYNGLVTKINEGADFSKKYVAVRSNVDVTNGTDLNEGKQLPENYYNLSLVTFKDGEKELGSVMVKNGSAATFETPADRIDGADKLVFEKWVTENGGDAEADLSAISGDAVVYAKFRRVFANAITAFDTADIVYGETPVFTATAKYGEAGITFAKEKDGEYKAWDKLENHNVGTYYVKASVAETSGYSAAEETKSFEVKKATNAMQLKMAATIKCTDTPEPAATAQHGEVKYTYGKDIDTVQNWDFATARYKDAAGNEIIDARLGYKVKATVEGTENYDGAEATAEFIVIHDFDENGLCKHCRKGQSCITYAEDGEKAYISGYESSKNFSGEIYSLAMYNDKPVTYVQWGVFSGKGITKAVFPVSIEDLDGNVFADCAKLEYVSMPGVKTLNYGETQRPYGTRYGNNNFLKCNALKTVIVASGFTANVQQFTNGNGDIAKLDNAVLILYVNGESSALKLDGNQNLWTGKVFYKGNATKCGQWNFDENGEIIHGASEHNYVDGICSNCGKYSEEKTQGVAYGYDATENNGNGAYYVDMNTTLNLSVVEILGKYNDGIHGELPVTYVRNRAFDGNTNITRVILPESVTQLDGNVFLNCSNLQYVSMLGIKDMTFKGISRSYSTKTIVTGNNFLGCSKLTTLIVNKAFNLFDDPLALNAQQFVGDAKCINIYAFGSEGDSNVIINKEGATGNNGLLSGKVYYYSENKPTETSKTYWHYVDGVATLWA